MTCPACGYEASGSARFCEACGQALASLPQRPAVPAAQAASLARGRYEIRRLLGEGSRKRVFLGHDTRLDRDVAVALIKADRLDETALARVHREARAMGKLGDHPNIVTLFDVGEENGQTYIISQHMAGGSLEERLRRAERRRLSLSEALRLARQVCAGLDHAHARGVVHRDVKPGNIWLTEDGTAALGDFGLAMAPERSRLTLEGMMVGTVAYMSPEQAIGRDVDARCDLYGLGAVLYEILTGRPPFLGDDALAIISQHMNTPPVAPSWHNPDIPRALEALILRLLAKAPEERPQNATTVRQALEAIDSTAATLAERPLPEESNPLDRLASGVFVGREREMDELRAAFEDTLSGRGRLVMLVGEAGIGKTRTAEEFVTYARLRSAQVLWGRCYEGDGAPAYWPWVQAIRDYVHHREPAALLSELGSGAGEIANVVSEVRQRLPGLPALAVLETEQARFRLFDSVTTFLKNVGRTQPLVLVLDDLHWADKPSLLLLQFLARELRDARLLVVGTCRDLDLGRQHPLSQTLAELARERLSHRILLRGLAEQDVTRFVEMTAGVKSPEFLVAAVYRETEGNPFFVNEVVRLLVTEGRLDRPQGSETMSLDIPQGVREVIGCRLGRLSSPCNGILTMAAVIGREFRLDTLERLSDLSADQLLDLLDEAVAARVVAEVPGTVGCFRFAHALVRETLYDELTATRRVRLHRRIGDALERLYAHDPEPHAAELAHHFLEAARGGDAAKAVAYARRAGERAMRLLAYEEAVQHYQRALEALERAEPIDEAGRCDLLLALGLAQTRAGETAGAKEVFLRAAESARLLRDPERLARAALDFSPPVTGEGFAAGALGRTDEVLVELLEEALRALPAEDSPPRANVLGRLAVALYWAEASERRDALSREAVEMAERIGDKATLATVVNMRRYALFGPENVEERLTLASQVLRLAEETGDLERAVEARCWRVSDLLELGDIRAVDREIEAHAPLARQLRQPLQITYTTLFRGLRALMAGRFAEAEMHAEALLAAGQRMRSPNVLLLHTAQMYWLRSEQGRLQDLQLVQSDISDQAAALPAARCGMAWTLCRLGMVEEGRTEFEALAAENFSDLPRDLAWLPAITVLVEVCTFLGDARRAARLYELLRPHAGRNILVGAPAVFCYGPASYYLGRLAATLGRLAEATAHFEQALAMSEAMGAWPFAAHAQHAYAEVLLARGDRAHALDRLNRALAIAQELGMKPLVEQALAAKLRAQGIVGREVKVSVDAVVDLVQQERPDLGRLAARDGTVTILFTDIEGSTAMTERLGDQRAQELLRIHNAMVREQVATHGGFEVKSLGDGFMIAFQSARRALRFAVALQRAFDAHNAEHGETPIRVRIGLHTGEVVREANDFFGKAVILAARIAAQARGGEILVSSLLRELAESADEIRFADGREVELKGLAGIHVVHSVAWAEAADVASS